MSKETAIRLLRQNRDEISKAVLRYVDKLAPGMQQVDKRARLSSILAFVDGFAEALSSGNPKGVASLIKNATRLRIAGGVSRDDVLASMQGYLPGIRRVFIDKAPDAKTATAAYDAVEEAALPLLVEVGRVILHFTPEEFDDEPTHPNKTSPRNAPGKKKKPVEHPFQSTESEG